MNCSNMTSYVESSGMKRIIRREERRLARERREQQLWEEEEVKYSRDELQKRIQRVQDVLKMDDHEYYTEMDRSEYIRTHPTDLSVYTIENDDFAQLARKHPECWNQSDPIAYLENVHLHFS